MTAGHCGCAGLAPALKSEFYHSHALATMLAFELRSRFASLRRDVATLRLRVAIPLRFAQTGRLPLCKRDVTSFQLRSGCELRASPPTSRATNQKRRCPFPGSAFYPAGKHESASPIYSSSSAAEAATAAAAAVPAAAAPAPLLLPLPPRRRRRPEASCFSVLPPV